MDGAEAPKLPSKRGLLRTASADCGGPLPDSGGRASVVRDLTESPPPQRTTNLELERTRVVNSDNERDLSLLISCINDNDYEGFRVEGFMGVKACRCGRFKKLVFIYIMLLL